MMRIPIWLWPNILAFDAVAVAIVWQRALAHIYHPIDWDITLVLAFTVWGVYLGDRWLDSRKPTSQQAERHRIPARHPIFFVATATVALLSAVITAWVRLEHYILFKGIVIGSFTVAYFIIVHFSPYLKHLKGLKELLVGVVFTMGIALPFLHEHHVIPAIIGLSGLLLWNCILISIWEHDPHSPSLFSTMSFIASLAIVIGIVTSPIAPALILSLILLLTLHLLRHRLGKSALRVLADLVLLTPILFLGPTIT